MIAFEELILVNYYHPDCTPLLNSMRLPRDEVQLFPIFNHRCKCENQEL